MTYRTVIILETDHDLQGLDSEEVQELVDEAAGEMSSGLCDLLGGDSGAVSMVVLPPATKALAIHNAQPAFEEWERRWREEPEVFMTDMARLAESTDSVAMAQARYFLDLLGEV